MNGHQGRKVEESDAPLAAGDPSDWLREHGDVLYRYARSQVGHRELAEDLVQETLLAAIRSHDRFAGRATIRTWLLSILRHKIVDHRRRTRSSASSIEAESAVSAEPVSARFFSGKGLWKTSLASWKAPEHPLEEREFWDVLDGCLDRLPPSLSAVFILRELEEMATAELLRALELSEVNLRVRLHRARLLLRECLEKHWFIETRDGTRNSP
jgi:RNA polymerase sigma-70 factor (ECF subfamily)